MALVKIAFVQKNVQNESHQIQFWKMGSCRKTSLLYTKTKLVCFDMKVRFYE